VTTMAIDNVELVAYDWRKLAACRAADPDVFLTPGDDNDEPPYPSDVARWYCDRCQVRPECLAYAEHYHIEYGIWGGLTAYQRRQLGRPRRRGACLGCTSVLVLEENGRDICLSCGLSWPVLA